MINMFTKWWSTKESFTSGGDAPRSKTVDSR